MQAEIDYGLAEIACVLLETGTLLLVCPSCLLHVVPSQKDPELNLFLPPTSSIITGAL